MIYKRTSESEDDMEELNEEDLIYIGDVDEVLDAMEDEANEEFEDEEFIPPRDDSCKTFTHEETDKSVFCSAMHCSKEILVTGTEGDKLHIWGLDGTPKSKFNFSDSVIASEFSSDDTLLASADMAGNIQVYNVISEPYSMVFEYAIGDTQFLFWHDKAHVLFAGSNTGDIYVLKVPKGDCKILLGHGCKVNCAVMMADGVRVAAGYDDGTVKIWDIRSSSVQNQVTVDSSVITIDSHFENNLIMIGSAQGNMSLINASNSKILNTVNISTESLESVSFYNNQELNVAAVGSVDGALVVWDVTRNAVRHTLNVEAGVVTIRWLPGAKIISAHLDGCTRLLDARSGTIEKVFMGHRKAILALSVSQDNKMFVSTSDDGTAKLFDLDSPCNEVH